MDDSPLNVVRMAVISAKLALPLERICQYDACQRDAGSCFGPHTNVVRVESNDSLSPAGIPPLGK